MNSIYRFKEDVSSISNYCSSKGFQNQVEFFKSLMSKGEMCHFPTSMYHIHFCKLAYLCHRYSKNIEFFIRLFNRRVALSKEDDIKLKLTEYPFFADPQ
jgi:hypothetical protein